MTVGKRLLLAYDPFEVVITLLQDLHGDRFGVAAVRGGGSGSGGEGPGLHILKVIQGNDTGSWQL